MPNIITNNVTWIPRGVRGHGSGYQPFGPSVPTSPFSGTGSLPVFVPVGETIPYTDASNNMFTLQLAFTCVTGAGDGNHVFFPGQAGTVPLGSTDITFTNIYVPISGPGIGGGAGVMIDAFDVNAGAFANDPYFVNVVTDPSLNDEANLQGFVPSVSAEEVQAYTSIHGVPFEQWLTVTGNETISTDDLFIPQKGTGISFAFFMTPVGSQPPQVTPNWKNIYEAAYTWVSQGVKVDGGGPTGNGPVDPWNPWVTEILAALEVAASAGRFTTGARSELLDATARQISTAANKIAHEMNSAARAHTELNAEMAN